MSEREKSKLSPLGHSAAELFTHAMGLHAAGDLPAAEMAYRQVLALDPAHAEAHFRLGLLATQARRPDLAVEFYGRAVQLDPRRAGYHLHLGMALSDLGRIEDAETCYREALRLQPVYPQAHNNLGNALTSLGRLEDAEKHYRQALKQKRDFAEAYNNLANALNLLQRYEEAEVCCRRALRLRPNYAAALNNLGNSLARRLRLEEAEACFRQALDINPRLSETNRNLGDTLTKLGKLDEALYCYREALRLNPGDALTCKALGDTLANLADFEQAERCYREAIRLQPDVPEVWSNLGLALSALGRSEEAETCYNEALHLRPDFLPARVNRCIARLPVIYRDEAEVERTRAAYAADLDQISSYDGTVMVTPGSTGGIPPFYLAYQGRNDRDLQARYGRLVSGVMSAIYPDWTTPPEVAPPKPGEPIRVGILSAYFYSHSNWKIPIKGWLAGLDHERFQLFGYHIGRTTDSETAVARKLCHRFVQGLPTLQRWAETIRADRLHVLLIPGIGLDDVTGRLAGLRLAPVQATSWGHPDTTGLPTIDDYLSSDLMEPPNAQEHYTERLVRLPNLSIWYEPLPLVPPPVSRAELGVEDDAVIYWCCQSLFKYLPRYDWVFAQIAAEVPKARFVFIKYPRGDTVTNIFRDRLKVAFAARGLEADRYCVFLAPMDHARFAGVCRMADVFLDSLGWSGCNSTLEGIAWDLPVVTMPGELMRGRHTTAILTMLGLPELIAPTPEAYVALAAELGRDPARRQALREQIARDKHRLYRDQQAIDGLARYIEDAATNPERRRNLSPEERQSGGGWRVSTAPAVAVASPPPAAPDKSAARSAEASADTKRD